MKVRKAAERLGYSKSTPQVAQRTVALLIAGESYSQMHELARRYTLVVNEECVNRQWQLLPIFQAPHKQANPDNTDDFQNKLLNAINQLSGCLVIDSFPESYYKVLSEHFGNNVVMICHQDVTNGLSGVTQMNYAGGLEAAKLLLQAGHTKIGWLGSLGSRDLADERLGGTLSAIRHSQAQLDCQVWLDDRIILSANMVHEAITRQLPTDRSQWPTAWVCSTDWLAAKLIVWARNAGLSVPDDVSVVAFDNTIIAENFAEIVIDTIVYPENIIVRKSIELLDGLINERTTDPIVWSLPPQVRRGHTLAKAKINT
jgi:DNA-binding LacI/PurR family transcriptional regulator